MPTTQETDGFQVKRPGDVNVKCTLLFMLDHQVPLRTSAGWSVCTFSRCSFDWLVTICSQPPQYKLDPRLARLLGVHTQTRASIMQALWLYIKNNKLQDCHEKEYINCNRYFRQVSNPQVLITLLWRMHLIQTLYFNIWLVFYSTVQIFGCGRMRFAEIPMKLAGLLQHPDPIIINHTIR